jgi:hypothetical protein
MGANQASFMLADLLDWIALICGIIVLINGIYELIFSKKVANKRKTNAKPNSKVANITEEDLTKRIRITGILCIIVGSYLTFQFFN